MSQTLKYNWFVHSSRKQNIVQLSNAIQFSSCFLLVLKIQVCLSVSNGFEKREGVYVYLFTQNYRTQDQGHFRGKAWL